MSGELVTWLRAQLDEDERVARTIKLEPWVLSPATGTHGGWLWVFGKRSADQIWGGDQPRVGQYIVQWHPERVLAEVAAKRALLELHAPTLENVEWWHDQTGKGKALVCPSCHPAHPSEWYPAFGEAGEPPEGFVPSYVLAPCPTLLSLLLPYADRPGYREEWRP